MPSRGSCDVSSLLAVISSGVMWSEQVKHGLLEQPEHDAGRRLLLVGGSRHGTSVSARGAEAATASFRLGDEPASSTRTARRSRRAPTSPGGWPSGAVSRSVTTRTRRRRRDVRDIDGKRSRFRATSPPSPPTVDPAARAWLACINTGGEKVFPEEVEEALKTPASRTRCPRGARRALGGVSRDGGRRAERREHPPRRRLIAHVKGRLAGYKAPRRVRVVDTIGRTPAGKMDYARHRSEMTAWLEATA